MFDATIDTIEPARVMRYQLIRDGIALTYSDVLALWQQEVKFRSFYTRLLADSPFSAYRWETPALTQSTANNSFEFVLLNCPEFCSRPTDAKTYENYFAADDTDRGIVSFTNLGGDATLIVPSPRTERDAYGHLAAFVRRAPTSQLESFWRIIGAAAQSCIGDNPIWLNTAGDGVAWLHVRLDSRPKYYGYSPYKQVI